MLAAPCPAPAQAASLPAIRAPLVADVDGDGRPDTVTIRLARRARLQCGLFLAVRTRGRVRAARISYGRGEFFTAGRFVRSSTYPLVNGAYALDRRRGLEVVVTALEGASDSFLQLFAFRGDRLVRLGLPRPYPEGFDWGGFAAAYGSIDCDHGRIRVTRAALVRGRRWTVTRAFYRIGARAARLVRLQTLHGSIRLTARYSRELSQRSPFPHCRGVRARRQI